MTCTELIGSPKERAELAQYDDGVLQDFLKLEDRIHDLLRFAPNAFFRAVGMAFVFPDVPLGAEEEARLQNRYGQGWRARVERQTILERARFFLNDYEWSVVEPYLFDTEVYDFLTGALTTLKRSLHQPVKTLSTDLKRARIQSFFRDQRGEIPALHVLLHDSPLFMAAFAYVANKHNPRFTTQKILGFTGTQALQMMQNGTFGSAQKFRLQWMEMMTTLYEMELVKNGIPRGPMLSPEEEYRKHEAFLTNSKLFEHHLLPFVRGMMEYLYAGNITYTEKEIRHAIATSLSEHHALLVQFAATPTIPVSPSYTRIYTPYTRPHSSQQEELTFDLNQLLEDQTEISIKPDTEYFVAFRRDFIKRDKIQRILFTERALRRMTETRHSASLRDWVNALTMGFAYDRGNNGIKLLQHSNVPGHPELRLEVKLLKTGLRLYGYRDRLGRWVFDYLADHHS